MTCPHCGSTNFDWASKCDQCGQPLGDHPTQSSQTSPIAPSTPPPEDGTWVDPEAEREREFAAHLDAGTPKWHVTTILIAVNVAVFIAMIGRGISVTQPSPEALLRWGANYGPLTAGGQWWRLVTSAFVHVGIMHLAMNMLVLFTGGRLTERLFGQPAFVVLYGLSALGGSIVSVTMHPMTPSAGASGAIFGVYGGVIAFLIVRRASLPTDARSALLQNAILFVGYNILYGLTQAHVDMAAHIGGLVTGFVAGSILAPPLGGVTTQARWQRPLAVAAAGLLIVVVATRRVPVFDDWSAALSTWLDASRRIDAQYDEAVKGLQKKSLTRQQFADRIEQTLVPEVINLQKRFASLRLPPTERATANKIATVLALRAESFSLMAKGERSGDPAVLEQAEIKQEEALAASLAVAPNDALKRQLGMRAKDREQQRAFAAEVERLAAFDKGAVAVYRNALTRVRVNHAPPSEFADKIEHDILGPWKAERERLAKLAVPERQKAARQRLLDYMDLRTEGWQLIATGARTNDAAKLRLGNEKHAAAAKLLATQPSQTEESSDKPGTDSRSER